jgi:hypothetical protein
MTENKRGLSFLGTVGTRVRDASTRVDGIVYGLRQLVDNEDLTPNQRWLISYEADDLMDKLVSTLRDLVPLLSTDEDEDWREIRADAGKLAQAIRAHYLAAKLEQVGGRTPEEAATFRRKAEQLREAAS